MIGVKLASQNVTHVVRLFEAYGIGNHLLTLLPGLVEAGLDVEEALKSLGDSGVRVTVLPFRLKSSLHPFGLLPVERTLDLVKLFQKRRNRIIHFHLEYFGIPTAIWLAGCAKVVMSIHSDDRWFMSFRVRAWLHIIDKLIGRYIAVSERAKAYYSVVANIDPKKIERIYHGINYVREQTT
ncbi:glycosyltransferase, partial [bacterium]|nr:glycosyltransferase [bacterium]